ncbi:major facilitator superfamily domain-containing protein 1 isoform X2 [Solea senegalensis]|uniref:Major facilitator superfamily domain-containing protein 1 isoform X2 n=2 Tax=Solea senegalensis TaxID=28829 RepID=A0AAV6PVR1_SOLSE|nr:major facilitator superfamily domain-containing protein 1 isoform X1 [Solea senegalensis]XP_043888782.1 major facilitator superfamily domain-containing protein 1 isoform X2 [Solea senegalensis]KAG7479059.1 major facilitator superfamily domain-containing protein 1 isoform X2 [Solea senegalensis]
MADFEERRSLLGDEDERFVGDREPQRGAGGTGGTGAMPAICDPRHLLHRVVVLVFMCFLGFGSYFCYDNPAALQTQVLQDLNLNTENFMRLYAWYSWPNVVLCFFGGFLLDRVFGIRFGTIIFSVFVCAGQIVFATGALLNHFWLMEAGRFIFGIGGESLAVAQNTYAVNWFKGKELNLVFGLQLSMARLGSTVNMNIMGWVYNKVAGLVGSPGYTALGGSLMIAAVTCLFSLICALVLAYLDKRAERILQKEQGGTGEVIKLTDVKDFPLTLWLIFIICVCYYVAIFPFIGLGQVFFIEKFNFSPAEARAVNSIVYIISAPASPILGFLVDKTGRNVVWVIIAVTATLAAHMMLAFTFWNPWIAMSLLGVSYSLLACALWPMVAFVVPEHQLGTAYGFMQSIQNLGLALIAMAAGAILDTRGYLVLEVFFCACICMALMAVVMLYFVDYLRGGDLNQSAAARARLQKEATSDAE